MANARPRNRQLGIFFSEIFAKLLTMKTRVGSRTKHRMIWTMAICLANCALTISLLMSQSRPADPVVDQMEQKGCASLASGTRLCKYDYSFEGRAVEAISFRPVGNGPFPGLLLIPGYDRTARDLVFLGTKLADAGFAGVAVSQPGFGKSQGPSDFVGPKTIAVLTAAYRKFQKEPFVDPAKMGIYGYSRGGMAASLLAVQLDDVKAAVFSAGVYDFQKLYDDSPLIGVRLNMSLKPA